jgi:hypothetical protein
LRWRDLLDDRIYDWDAIVSFERLAWAPNAQATQTQIFLISPIRRILFLLTIVKLNSDRENQIIQAIDALYKPDTTSIKA